MLAIELGLLSVFSTIINDALKNITNIYIMCYGLKTSTLLTLSFLEC